MDQQQNGKVCLHSKVFICSSGEEENLGFSSSEFGEAAVRKSPTPKREVRLLELLPALLHFPGNCSNRELMGNNEPAHRGREDNSEQQQRKLMGSML